MAELPVSELPSVEPYRRSFGVTWADETLVDDVRFVVLDTETTGFDPETDRIVTIGAIAVQNGEIVLRDSFDALLKVAANTESVTVHGVTRDESRKGIDEPAAVAGFLNYLKDGVIVGHHIGHDVATFDAACTRHWGFQLSNRVIDTLTLTLLLEKDGAFANRPPIRRRTLDALCEMFDVIPHDRHTAVGDAFITAQVFLRLRHLALKHGRSTLAQISEEVPE